MDSKKRPSGGVFSLLASGILLWQGLLWWMPPSSHAYKKTDDSARHTLTPQSASWDERVHALADRTSMEAYLKSIKYPIPDKTFLLATRIVEGVDQPAFVYYSLRNTGFVHSYGQYWPASLVKMWAAVNALLTLQRYKLDSMDIIAFTDNFGAFKGRVADLLRKLDNVNYDRFLRIAGRDAVNDPTHRARYGLKETVLHISYNAGSNVALSPEILYWRKKPCAPPSRRRKRAQVGLLPCTGKIPPRAAKLFIPSCPRQLNCTTLFEMQDILRRIMLHESLPPSERFDLPLAEIKRLQKALWRRRHKIWVASQAILGQGTEGYGKSGSRGGDNQMDNLYITSPKGRFFVAAGSPWYREDPDAAPSMIELEQLGRYIFKALLTLPQKTAPLQADAGLPLNATLRSFPCESLRYEIRIEAPPAIQQLDVWSATQRLSLKRSANHFIGNLRFPKDGRHILALQGRGEKPLAYRALAFDIPPPSSPSPSCQANPSPPAP